MYYIINVNTSKPKKQPRAREMFISKPKNIDHIIIQ